MVLRRFWSLAAAVATLLSGAAAPALAGVPVNDVGDDLVAELDGFTILEGTPPTGSGPMSGEDFATFGGMSGSVDGLDEFSGYVRIFTDDSGDGIIVLGIRGPSVVDDTLRTGFEAGAGPGGIGDREPLFAGEPDPLGEVDYYPGGPATGGQVVTLVSSGDLAVAVFALDAETLRTVVRAQHAITPLDDGVDTSRGDRGAAYAAGRIVGMLIVLGIPVLVIVWLVRRSTKKRAAANPAAAWPPQGPPTPGAPYYPPPTSPQAPPPPPSPQLPPPASSDWPPPPT